MSLVNIVNESHNNVDTARKFLMEVRKLADRYDLPFFIVTDGASMYNNNGCEAVRHTRNCHIEWEKSHGHDPYEDWGHKYK